jgi:CRP/FNR family cyclic AMP-dependent transcriptional regulator
MRAVQWMEALPREVRETIARASSETHHPKGELIARFGEVPKSWIGVVDGLLKVSRVDRCGRGMMLTGVPQGRWIGEAAILRGDARRYDIVAVRDSRLLHIPAATVRGLLEASVEFSRVVLTQLHERVAQSIQLVEIERLDDPVARVARTLATVFEPVPGLPLPLSQSELGELVGLSRQCVGGALKHLGARGLLTAEYGRVVLNDVDALKAYR